MIGSKKKSTVVPYEAVGAIAAQSIGEPGTQMSLPPEERVIIKINNEIKIVKIGEFIDLKIANYEGGSCSRANGHSEIYDSANDSIFALGLDQEEKLTWKRITSCIRHKNNAKLIRLKTASGRKITATPYHSFVVRSNNQIVPVAGSELKAGDRIPAVKYLPENCIGEISTSNFMPEGMRIVEHEGLLSTERSKTTMPTSMELNSSFGWFIGAYLSEGSLGNGEVCISNTDENFLSNAREFAEFLHAGHKEFQHHRGFAWSNDLRIRSSLLRSFMENICGKGSSFKHVPGFAYSSPAEFVSALLRGYFDGDGNVNVEKGIIRVSSNSEELLDGIKLLLTRFGIFAHKVKDKKQPGLLIPYKYASLFLDAIGSDIEAKRVGLEKLAALSGNKQDYTDMIGGFGDLLYNTAKKVGYPVRYVNNFTKQQKIGRSALVKYTGLFRELSKKKNVDVSRELSIMERICNSDVVWDEIRKVEYFSPDSEYVYDFSVEDVETFATFDGLITHNTMRTFHYAGVAEHVPTGLPRLIELVDAKKEPKKPAIAIYLKSPHHKNEDFAREVAKKVEEVIISDIAGVSDDLQNRTIMIAYREKEGKNYGVTFTKLKDIIRKEYKGVRTGKSRIKIVFKKEDELRTIRKVTNKISSTIISGVPGIKKAVVLKEGEEYFIMASGFNISGLVEFNKNIDPTRVYTNNVKEMERIFGIEAARNAIVKEIKQVMDMQKLFVDIRHIMLVADAVCASGKVDSIGRHGLSGHKIGVLARAAFEETVKHLLNAASGSEEDNLVGVTENVIIGQTVPVGTGNIRLAIKESKK